ncbi:MAG: transposase [Actinobacteria bacterium]|nr:transposase [Actinomycetota bacterium]
MEFYCGIDLHARKSSLVVIDERGEKVGQATMKNELERILAFLARFEGEVTCVVESTFNWYWLVDGLRCHGYKTKLAHAYGLHLITGSKFKSDLRDAHRLARLLRLGEIPCAYIYPADKRPARDLMRQRIRLVKERGRLRSSLKNTLSRYNVRAGGASTERAIAAGVDGLPLTDEVKMDLAMTVERIALLTSQIERMESWLTGISVDDPRFRELMHIPGIGYVLALTIYYETGEAHRFPAARNYAAHCLGAIHLQIGGEGEEGKKRKNRATLISSGLSARQPWGRRATTSTWPRSATRGGEARTPSSWPTSSTWQRTRY